MDKEILHRSNVYAAMKEIAEWIKNDPQKMAEVEAFFIRTMLNCQKNESLLEINRHFQVVLENQR
jgi:hypothetical protein